MSDRNHSACLQRVARACIVAALALAGGCAERPQVGGPPQGEGPAPPLVLRLAGRAEAQVIQAAAPSPTGPGAEARAGDLVLENALVRFVVGAADRSGTCPLYAGAVIDAAVQGGEDYLRALAPHLGPGPIPSVICEEVRVARSHVSGGPAAVMAMGHWVRNPAVVVRTFYELEPDSPALGIVTSVENLSPTTLRGVELGDIIYTGRTEVFAEGLGLDPAGRSGQTTWLSFFADRYVWGLFAAAAMPIYGAHYRGWSRLAYAEHTIPPGEARTFRRRLVATYGGPDQVAAQVLTMSQPPTGEVEVEVLERGTRTPVPRACLVFDSPPGRPATLVLTDTQGRARVRLRAGDCRLTCTAPGRELFECDFGVLRGACHQMAVRLCPPARLRVRVRENAGGLVRPTSARITLAHATPGTPPLREGAPSSQLALGDTVLVPASGEIEVPLSPVSADRPATYMVIASKGPLYEAVGQRVLVQAGSTTDVEFSLHRVVDAEHYAAVDFGQRMDSSPDSALTFSERILLNDCEGLDGAFVAQSSENIGLEAKAAGGEPPLMPALAVTTPHTGRTSVLLAAQDLELPGGPLPPATQWGSNAEEVFGLLRRHFPRSLIQVENPLDKEHGYFQLTGFRPGAVPRLPFSEHFDAIRLLTAGSGRGAAELLQHWFELLNRGRRVLITAGSDSASVRDARLMSSRTYIHCPRAGERPDRAELMNAVEALADCPNAFVSNGPFLKVTASGMPPGSVVRASEGKVRMHVRVEAPLWVAIKTVKVLRGGRPVQVIEAGQRTETVVVDRELEVETPGDCWLVVLAEGDASMAPLYCDERGFGATAFALTNPFWVDADGDGIVSLTR